MERKRSADGDMQFAAILCPLVSEQWQRAGGAACAFTARTVEASSVAPKPQGEKHSVLLRFEGALTGHCVLVCPEASAAALGAGSDDDAGLLTQVLRAASEPIASALFAHYGSVRIHIVEDSLTVPADAEPVAELVAELADPPTEGSPEACLVLYADGELQRGLLRLARVAAAAEASGITGGNLGLVMDVELEVTLRFGQRQLSLREVMDLASGSVVELDREVDEPVELILDGRVIARGEAVIVDGNYGVRVTEVLQPMVL